MNKPYFSATQLSMYYRCAMQYMFRYEEGLRIQPPVVFIVGGSFHACGEADLRNVIVTGSLLDTQLLLDMARDSVNNRWDEEGVALDEAEKKAGEKKVRGAAVDTTIRLAATHHSRLAPYIKPAYVEREWLLEIDGYPYDLKGYIDVQETPGTLPVGRVRELKSAGKKPSDTAQEELIQLTAYAAAVNVLDGAYPEIIVDYVTKAKEPEIYSRRVERGPDDVKGLLMMIETLTLAKERGLFPPTGLGKWYCGDRCGYSKTKCKYYRRGSK